MTSCCVMTKFQVNRIREGHLRQEGHTQKWWREGAQLMTCEGGAGVQEQSEQAEARLHQGAPLARLALPMMGPSPL